MGFSVNMFKAIAVSVASAFAFIAVVPGSAQAAAVPNPTTCALTDVSDSIECAGYYTGNILNNDSSNRTTQITALAFLGQDTSSDTVSYFSTIFNPANGYIDQTLDANGDVSFAVSPTLFGTTYVGIHWGGGRGGGRSAIYRLNITSPVSSLSVLASNPGGFSNAVLYATERFTQQVPEPASWAMIIVGFGSVGAVMRRRRAAVIR